MKIKKIIYLSYTRLDYSLNSVCIKGLKENGVEIIGLRVKDRGIAGLLSAIFFYWRNSKNVDMVMVGYDSPVMVIFLRVFCCKPIVYNAVLSVYERVIISRELASRFSVKAIYYWLTDFVAVHFANLIMVETNYQADYFKKIFKVSRKKLYKNWIGADEDRFFYDPAVLKSDVFTVLFRGALMPEAGVEYVVRAAKILEDKNVRFIIIGGGLLLEKTRKFINELKPTNLEHITDFMSYDILRATMQKCHLSLGQFSDHERLARTIPHKAYESLVMKLPYLTAHSRGILELLIPNQTCLICNPADAKSLAGKILWAKHNYSLTEKIAENGYELYQNKLKSSLLAKNLLDTMADGSRVAVMRRLLRCSRVAP